MDRSYSSGPCSWSAAIDPDALIRINSEARRVLGLLRSKSRPSRRSRRFWTMSMNSAR
jgi:hypothetical protein